MHVHAHTTTETLTYDCLSAALHYGAHDFDPRVGPYSSSSAFQFESRLPDDKPFEPGKRIEKCALGCSYWFGYRHILVLASGGPRDADGDLSAYGASSCLSECYPCPNIFYSLTLMEYLDVCKAGPNQHTNHETRMRGDGSKQTPEGKLAR
jgi:hypothetical protein